MVRQWQYFEAPGDVDTPLIEGMSPWVTERLVMLPVEQWELILNWLKKHDRWTAETLRKISYGAYQEEDSYITEIDQIETSELVRRLATFADLLENGSDLLDAPTDEIPDVLASEEHARMLRNVSAAFNESLVLKSPVKGWSD